MCSIELHAGAPCAAADPHQLEAGRRRRERSATPARAGRRTLLRRRTAPHARAAAGALRRATGACARSRDDPQRHGRAPRRPSSPVTDTGPSPRSAATKLSNSRRSGSPSGACSGMRSTNARCRIGPEPSAARSMSPRSRKNSPSPAAQVERQISALLEDSNLAHPLARDAARRDVGHRARLNVTRAFAMSTNRREHRHADRATRVDVLPPTSVSTRSMSWIIRSSTTATSDPRGLNGASRSLSMNRGLIDVRQRSADGAVESLDVTDLDDRARSRARCASSSSASSSVVVIGFSMNDVLSALQRLRSRPRSAPASARRS